MQAWRRSWAVLLLAVVATLAGAAVVRAQDAPALRPEPVAPGVWFVQGASALGSPANRNFISNAAFVVTPQGVVVIDALGSPALARELMQAIAKVTPQRVTHVIVTHYHADHIYGLQAFVEAGARVVAHRAALEYLNSDTAALRLKASRDELAPWIDESTRLVPADDWLTQRTTLRVGGVAFEIEPLGPAHTPEDLAVWLPSQRVLFAGDLVFRGRIPFVGQANTRQWIDSLDALLKFDAQTIVPGHGPLSTSARQDMRLTADYLRHLRETMGRAARNMEPFDEAYAAADWTAFEHLPLFRVANRMNAYNTYLQMEREP
ncbi:MAG: hypothetical protein RL014_2113 [Pseudomonadota bacterium]|jgi:glyoxylase-like metal-dependent hydrolase (beta-lactamase superfamily II)